MPRVVVIKDDLVVVCCSEPSSSSSIGIIHIPLCKCGYERHSPAPVWL
jgi:hypothetical protein